MADLNKIAQRYEATSDTSGLDSIGAAADKAASATGKLSTAAQTLTTASEKADKSALGVAEKLDRLSRAADPAQKALAAVERQQRLIDAATRQGQPVREEWTRALDILRAKHADLTKATVEHTAVVGFNRMQMMESMHVAKAFADSVIAGASPLRALSMEGGRLAQIFAEGSGGVGGTLKAIGGTVARLASGWLGFGVAVATGVAVAGIAVARFQGQQDRLALSLNGVGRASGVSLGGLTAIANAGGARNPALGQGGATNLAAQLASTGKISAGLMPGIMDLVTPYAHGTGQDLTKAGAELAKAFADPGKGAEMLNEKLGFLDAKTKDTIASFERQGDLLAAQQTLLTKAATAAQNLGDRTWRIANAWDRISGAVGSSFSRVGAEIDKLVNEPSARDRIDTLTGQRTDPKSVNRTIFQRPATSEEITENILQLRRGLLGPERDKALTAANDKRTNDLSESVLEVVKGAMPEAARAKELADKLTLLTNALKSPETLDKVPGGAAAVGESAQRLSNVAALADPAARAREESLLSAQAIQAQTGAERTLIEARKAEIEVMASGGSAALQAAKSLSVWNDAIAKSNKEADDALRSANQRAGLLGLSPLQRALKEVDYRYDEMRRNAVIGVSPAARIESPAPAAIAAPVPAPLVADIAPKAALTKSAAARLVETGSAPAPTLPVLTEAALTKSAAARNPFGDMSAPAAAFARPSLASTPPSAASPDAPLAAAAAPAAVSAAWARGIDQTLAQRTAALVAAVPGLNVISGYRSTERQAALYAELSGTGHPVAPPGSSLHERGLAVDLGGGGEAISRARALASQYGLAFPVPGDINHMELARGASASIAGPTRIGRNAEAAARFAPGDINVNGGVIRSTSASVTDTAQSTERRTAIESLTIERLTQSSEELQRNQDLLDVRTKSIGLSTDAMTKAIHVQEDWNQLQLTAADRTILGSDRIKKLGTLIDTLATKQTAYDKQQAQNKMLMDASNSFQQMGNSVVSSAGNELGSLFNANPRDLASQLSIGDQAKFYSGQISGKDVKAKIFKRKMEDMLRDMVFQQGIGMVQKGLFGSGQYGQPGSSPGLLGGLFNGLLGGITGGGGGGGGSIGGLFSLLGGGGGISYAAAGGVMTSRGMMPLRRYAGGGIASSPQMAMFGEGSRPEAYVPLPDGRRIPVVNQGGPGAGGVNFRGGDLHVHGSIDSATLPQVQAMIDRSNKTTVSALQRNFGAMGAKNSQRFG